MVTFTILLIICQILPLAFAVFIKFGRGNKMKVLFAVSNEEISENIVKKYQREYKEIISYKMFITLMQF